MPVINYSYLPAFNPATYFPVQDTTGINPANRVTSEVQTLTAAAGNDFHFLVPLFAPFFLNGLIVSYQPTVGVAAVLTEGIDYLPAFQFIGASRACSSPIYGGISFLNRSLTGTITLTYQTIGGNWTINQAAITAILSDAVVNPRVITWETVANYPSVFPVVDHQWNLDDMVGAVEIANEIRGVAVAIAARPVPSMLGLATHLAAVDNPHEIDAAQVGLGNVQDYGIASQVEAEAGSSNIKYMTPLRTKQAIDALVVQATDTVRGKVALNQGSNLPGDDTNDEDALTAYGLTQLVNDPGENALKAALRNGFSGMVSKTFTPFPLAFPLVWQGTQYTNLTSLRQAVEVATSVNPMPYNMLFGKMFAPVGSIIPSLAWTPYAAGLPVINPLSVSSGVELTSFTASFTTTGTSLVAVTAATLGTGWTVNLIGPNNWTLTGTLPAAPAGSSVGLSVTISAENINGTVTRVMGITSTSSTYVTPAVTIGPFASATGPASSTYSSLVTITGILSSANVSVSATAGSGWTIAYQGDVPSGVGFVRGNSYLVTGTMPVLAATTNVTVSGTNASGTVTRMTTLTSVPTGVAPGMPGSISGATGVPGTPFTCTATITGTTFDQIVATLEGTPLTVTLISAPNDYNIEGVFPAVRYPPYVVSISASNAFGTSSSNYQVVNSVPPSTFAPVATNINQVTTPNGGTTYSAPLYISNDSGVGGPITATASAATGVWTIAAGTMVGNTLQTTLSATGLSPSTAYNVTISSTNTYGTRNQLFNIAAFMLP